MENLGNTCYMNSVMQVLFTLPPFIKDYVHKAEEVFNNCNFENPDSNFLLQMTKLGVGLHSGDYSTSAEDEVGIRPAMFKNLIGRGHSEFSSKGQQDAQHFYLHIFDTIIKENHKMGKTTNAFNSFQMEVEDRRECSLTGKVKYSYLVDNHIPLVVPIEAATNMEAVAEWNKKSAEAEARGERLDNKDLVRPFVPVEACLEAFFGVAEVSNLKKTMRPKTFPDFLLVQLLKFARNDNWLPTKLDVEVGMPDHLDLTKYAATGLQPGEELMLEEEDDKQTEAVLETIKI
jgi:ubiquitin carboxyl-terminal hydrolase 5/13